MKPILTVEGKEFEVIGMHWCAGKPYKVEVVENHPLESKTYYDTNWQATYIEEPLKIDLSKHLFDKEQLVIVNEISTAIDKMIEDKSKELTGMSLEHTEACLKYPHSDDSLLQEYALLKREQIGLIKAQEVIESYMTEDVDLSGGEEIE